ncbi:hypothetical protein PoB_005513400 [Plakobranchus ocellatus]|uniref:Uncharacterized protein n=1 Tax=Plakobranchus ocellatus TaxID=259542 RepID=A0AAV4CBZ4_9GAST|nr:hypothetical protein PoB_005513400 [Plakobranchus ocellatus]
MRGHVMASPFRLSNRATDVRPCCKTQRIAQMLRQDESRSRLGVLLSKKTRMFPNMYCWTYELLSSVWVGPWNGLSMYRVGSSKRKENHKGKIYGQ